MFTITDYDNNNGNEDEEEEEDTEGKPDESDNENENNEVEENNGERARSESDPYAASCSENQGGCDHKCNYIENENRIQCECFTGFKLVENDGRTCHGKF